MDVLMGVQILILSAMAKTNNDPILPPYRLPPDIIPHHYDLEVTTNLEPHNFTFEGNVKIKVECLKPTNTIKVHAKDLTYISEIVSVKPAGENNDHNESVQVNRTEMDTENEFIIIVLNEPLSADLYVIEIPFQGSLKENLVGYYRSSYLVRSSNTTEWLAVTHFEPTAARRAFPCFDEPGMKATFSIRLVHKDHLISISNMPILKKEPIENKPGWVLTEFQPTLPMSTYIVAYMVGNLQHCQAEPLPNNQVQFRVWSRPEALNQTKFALSVGPKFLSYYEDFFNMKYPLPKQDLLAIPDFKIGAMENWGMITFREATLLLDDKSTSSSFIYAIANVIAHELAHMWFGNLVSIIWWTDLWLKEGFATYMADLCVHHEFPEWNSLDSAAFSNFLTVTKRDALSSTHPVSVPIGHHNEITQVFDAISYDKGSFLLRMMCLFLGEEVFRHGVSQYLKKHQYKSTKQDDLWASLTEQAHRYHAIPAEITVKIIMDTWTLQAGYPLVTAIRNYETHQVTVTQKRMLSVVSKNPDDYKGSWWVPLSYCTAKEPTFNHTQPQHWLSSDEESCSFDIGVDRKDWFILNNRASGLFRVNYDKENWMMLIDVLHNQHQVIDVLNRAQLVADAMDLALIGTISYDLAFKVLSYLYNETSLLPWKAAINKLQPIKVILFRSAYYGYFSKFMHFLLKPLMKRFGGLTYEPDNFENAQLLSMIADYACLYDSHWSSQAKQLFAQWKRALDPDKENPIPRDVRKAVYTYAITVGSEDDWTFLWTRYTKANLSTERSCILRALAATKVVWLQIRYLVWSLNESSGVRKQDAHFVFNSIANSDSGFYIAKDFLFQNMETITSYFTGNADIVGRYFSSVAENGISEMEFSQMTEFYKSHKTSLASGSLFVSQALEILRRNMDWSRQHLETISSILTEYTRPCS